MPARKCEDWLDTYLEYTANQEPTDKLNFWCGATAISGVLKRQIWMKRVRYKLYPNLFIMIIAESATARKSRAMDEAVALMKAADPGLFYISGSMTPEGLVKHMNRQKKGGATRGDKVVDVDSHVVVHMDELAESFGYDRQRASKFTILLTKIYNAGDEQQHTIASDDQITLRNLYPVVIGGSDPANLKVLPEEAIGGLIGRTIFITETTIKRPIGWETPEEAVIADRLYPLLKDDLNRISRLNGECKIEMQAAGLWDDWYHGLFKSMPGTDPRTKAFKARCHDTALKLAMIFAVAESDELMVRVRHVQKAIIKIEGQMDEFSNIQGWAAASEYAQQRAKLIDLLRKQGGAGMRSQAMRFLNLSLEEIVLLEGSLEAEETMEVRIHGRVVYYKLSEKELKKKL